MLYKFDFFTSSKTFIIPGDNVNEFFTFFKENPSFKRRHLFSFFFETYQYSKIESISTEKQCSNGRKKIYTVEFKDITHSEKLIFEILSRIDLKKLHEIIFMRYEKDKITGRLTRRTGPINSFENRIILNGHASGFSRKHLEVIIKHLGELPKDKFNSNFNINKFINIHRSNGCNCISITDLQFAYKQILLWCSNEKEILLNDKLRNTLLLKLITKQENIFQLMLTLNIKVVKKIFLEKDLNKTENDITAKYIQEDGRYIDDLVVKSIKALISHAMTIAYKTRNSQRMDDRKLKRDQAIKIWESRYKNKSKAERRNKKISQRSIAREIGVSLGTISTWFKEFENAGNSNSLTATDINEENKNLGLNNSYTKNNFLQVSVKSNHVITKIALNKDSNDNQ